MPIGAFTCYAENETEIIKSAVLYFPYIHECGKADLIVRFGDNILGAFMQINNHALIRRVSGNAPIIQLSAHHKNIRGIFFSL